MKQILSHCLFAIVFLSINPVQADSEDELYVSPLVEARLPRLITPQQKHDFLTNLVTSPIQQLTTGCGRGKNRKAVLKDGLEICILNRDWHTKARNELLYFLLASYLDIPNLPSFFTHFKYSENDPRWFQVHNEIHSSEWDSGDHLLAVQFIPDLSPAYFPDIIWNGELISRHTLHTASTLTEIEMAQWSDLIIQDFLSGDSDRLYCSLINSQWNKTMGKLRINNLRRTEDKGLVFLDGELSFQHGYSISKKNAAYRKMQEHFLNKLCLFRKPVIDKIQYLSRQPNPLDFMLRAEDISTQTRSWLMGIPTKDKNEFKTRLNTVLNRVKQCSQTIPGR